MGVDSILGNIGITIILAIIVLILLILVIYLLNKCKNKKKLSQKSRDRITSLTEKVFFNPLIRFSLLNTLKWNSVFLAGFTKLKGTPTEVAISVLLYLAINALPFFYMWILYKLREELH